MMIVEASLTDRRDLRMLRQTAQLRKKILHLVLDVVGWMPTTA